MYFPCPPAPVVVSRWVGFDELAEVVSACRTPWYPLDPLFKLLCVESFGVKFLPMVLLSLCEVFDQLRSCFFPDDLSNFANEISIFSTRVEKVFDFVEGGTMHISTDLKLA